MGLMRDAYRCLAGQRVEVSRSTPRVLYAERLQAVGSMRRTVCTVALPSKASWIEVWFGALAPRGRRVLSRPAATRVT